MQKTIFIIITRSFITRNILRSGTLDLLKKQGYTVVVFFQTKSIPEYIERELGDEQVKLVAIKTPMGRWHAAYTRRISTWLMLTKSTKKRALYFNEKATFPLVSKEFLIKTKVFPLFRLLVLHITSRFRICKFLYRLLALKLFPQKHQDIQNYFDLYKPDVVFSTSITSHVDMAFMKEAKRRNIPTISMPKSWDVMPLDYFQFIPDYLLVPNEVSRVFAVKQQDIPGKIMHLVGLPQFDWYVRQNIIKDRREYCARKSFDENRRIIFFGSSGRVTNFDYEIAEHIYEWIKNDELAKKCQILARPHFTNADKNIFGNLRNKKHAFIDSFRLTRFLHDQWDPSLDEIIDFTNSLYHSAVMVNPSSTLSLDAVCFDKPVINLSFGCIYEGGDRNKKDKTGIVLHERDHYQWVFDTGGTSKVNALSELKKQINEYLVNPHLHAEGRERLRQQLCYKVDGKSSERIVAVINHVVKKYDQ